MAFLSEILGRTVTDLDGVVIGKIEDVIARERVGFPHPAVDAVMVDNRGEMRLVPSASVLSLFTPSIPLHCRADELPTYELGSEDIYLSRDVLDKQIIDTDGARVVRVNDLELVRVNGTLYVTNVDVGLRGILRRSGMESAARMGKEAPAWIQIIVRNHPYLANVFLVFAAVFRVSACLSHF